VLAFLSADGTIVFTIALALMGLIGLVEIVGLGMSGSDVDVDLDGDGHSPVLDWLGFGRVPFLMLLVVLLACFGSIGLLVQQIARDMTGAMLPPLMAIPAAAIAALPVTSATARILGRIMPKDETTAVPLDVLVGRSATIVVGRATQGSPARARVEDQYGQPHYVMAEPDNPDQAFTEGEQILLVRREGHIFRAIASGNALLPSLEF